MKNKTENIKSGLIAIINDPKFEDFDAKVGCSHLFNSLYFEEQHNLNLETIEDFRRETIEETGRNDFFIRFMNEQELEFFKNLLPKELH